MMLIARIRDKFRFPDVVFTPRMSEWITTGALFGCGQILVANETLMTTSVVSANYEMMLALGTQEHWSFVLRMVSVARIVLLAINGTWKKSPFLRALFALLCCLIWLQIVLSFFPLYGFGFVFSMTFLIIEVMNVMRAARESAFVPSGSAGDGGTT